MSNKVFNTTLLSSVLAAALASPMAVAEIESDPWEGFNRSIYQFNKQADRFVIKPLAQGYQAVTPDIVETGIHNFFSNLGDVNSLVNNVFQFKPEAAATDFARITFNTTFGLAGLIDVATPMGLVSSDEDFGQTLGYWGLTSGPYLVLPFFGPSSVRDGLGRIPDNMMDVWPEVTEDIPTRNVGYGLRTLDTRVSFFAAERMIAGDEYSFIRDAYLQKRKFDVRDGKMDTKFNSNDF